MRTFILKRSAFISKRFVLSQIFSLFIFSGIMAGCATSSHEPQHAAQDSQLQAQTPLTEQIPNAPTEQQKIINTLLSNADWALSQNRLLNPISDNAHDRYRSVLLMDPDNERAKQGLQTIALRFLDLARTAIAHGNIADAQTMMKYARSIDTSVAVQEASEKLRKQMISLPPTKPYQPGESEIVLDGKLLQIKDAQILTQLSSVAQKAKQTDQFVLIVARSDSEGRWIYQQLRSAVPGYLVRGDIRIGQPARVKLVKFLE